MSKGGDNFQKTTDILKHVCNKINLSDNKLIQDINLILQCIQNDPIECEKVIYDPTRKENLSYSGRVIASNMPLFSKDIDIDYLMPMIDNIEKYNGYFYILRQVCKYNLTWMEEFFKRMIEIEYYDPFLLDTFFSSNEQSIFVIKKLELIEKYYNKGINVVNLQKFMVNFSHNPIVLEYIFENCKNKYFDSYEEIDLNLNIGYNLIVWKKLIKNYNLEDYGITYVSNTDSLLDEYTCSIPQQMREMNLEIQNIKSDILDIKSDIQYMKDKLQQLINHINK